VVRSVRFACLLGVGASLFSASGASAAYKDEVGVYSREDIAGLSCQSLPSVDPITMVFFKKVGSRAWRARALLINGFVPGPLGWLPPPGQSSADYSKMAFTSGESKQRFWTKPRGSFTGTCLTENGAAASLTGRWAGIPTGERLHIRLWHKKTTNTETRYGVTMGITALATPHWEKKPLGSCSDHHVVKVNESVNGAQDGFSYARDLTLAWINVSPMRFDRTADAGTEFWGNDTPIHQPCTNFSVGSDGYVRWVVMY
jgi:hypothetical protein